MTGRRLLIGLVIKTTQAWKRIICKMDRREAERKEKEKKRRQRKRFGKRYLRAKSGASFAQSRHDRRVFIEKFFSAKLRRGWTSSGDDNHIWRLEYKIEKIFKENSSRVDWNEQRYLSLADGNFSKERKRAELTSRALWMFFMPQI